MSISTVELKLDSIELSGSDKERAIYFVLAATSTENAQSLAVSHLPDSGNLTIGKHQTEYDFAPAGDSAGRSFSVVNTGASQQYAECQALGDGIACFAKRHRKNTFRD